jgi:hypothetical protein
MRETVQCGKRHRSLRITVLFHGLGAFPASLTGLDDTFGTA